MTCARSRPFAHLMRVGLLGLHVGVLVAASLVFHVRGARADVNPAPAAEVFVEACLKTAALPDRIAALASANGWSSRHTSDLAVASWTLERGEQTVRVFLLRHGGSDSCSVSMGKAQEVRAARERFLVAIRDALARLAAWELAPQHFDRRNHYDGHLRYDRYWLALPATEPERPSDGRIEVALEVSIRDDKVVRVTAWWPRASGKK